jgi:hypothetical protein
VARLVDARTFSGDSGRVLIGGVEVGQATGIDFREDFGTEGVYVFGDNMPQEHITQRWTGTITVDAFFLRKQDLANLGIVPNHGHGGLELPPLDIQFVDIFTSTKLLAKGCTIASHNVTNRANAFSVENAAFLAIDVQQY